MSDAEMFDADVIVVGAGPIGLTTGCALRHYGVDSLILEQRKEVKPHSRANNLWARQQELLAGIGVRDALAEKAYEVTTIENIFFGEHVDPIRLDDVASAYPFAIYTGQDILETRLEECYRENGGRIERGRRVTDVEQDVQGVSVRLTDDPDGNGSERTLRCRYLVGADGVEGTIRKALGLDFETEEYPNRVNRTIDAKLSWSRPTGTERMWFFYFEKGFLGVLPVWGGYHRIFCITEDAGAADRDPTPEEMQALAREIIGDDGLMLDAPIWCSHNRFQHAVSPEFAKGRVFLAGDAGHFSLPIGGQGMNTGFHDAIGIGWRLAMAIEGVAGDAILASYSAERCGEHQRVDHDQSKGFDRLMYRGPVGNAGLKAATHMLPGIGSFIFGVDDLHQLSVAYPDSPLSDDRSGLLTKVLPGGTPSAGDRVPYVIVPLAEGGEKALLDIVATGSGPAWSWTLLAFGTPLAELEAVGRLGFVRIRSVHRAVDAHGSAAPGDLLDPDGVLANALGVGEDGTCVLIRPDGHIALISDDPAAIGEYSERHFSAPSPGNVAPAIGMKP